jgi:hypothetical protein
MILVKERVAFLIKGAGGELVVFVTCCSLRESIQVSACGVETGTDDKSLLVRDTFKQLTCP